MKPRFERTQLVGAQVDYAELARRLKATPREYAAAMARGLNRAAAKAAADTSRQVATDMKVSPQSLVRRRIRIKKAKPVARPEVTIGFLVTPVSAIRLAGVRDTSMTKRGHMLGTRRKGTGVVASGGHKWRDAFIAEGSGGKSVVFRRKGKPRLPLEAIKIDIQARAREVLLAKGSEAVRLSRDLVERDMTFRRNRRLGIV